MKIILILGNLSLIKQIISNLIKTNSIEGNYIIYLWGVPAQQIFYSSVKSIEEYTNRFLEILGAEINDEYMIKKYSKNLSKEWKEYLKIFNDNNWWLDLFYDEIKFLSIYPNFCMQDIINSDLKNYMSRFSEYKNNYCDNDNDKALYQKFLLIKDNNIQ